MAVLRKFKKFKFSFSCHLQINNIKKIQEEKLIQILMFLKLYSAYEVLTRRNVM